MSEGINDTRGFQRSISMCQSAWDFVDELQKEQNVKPVPGMGRVIEKILFKEKARREKAQKAAKSQPAA